MSNTSATALQQFENQVGLKFQLYNSLFTSLPFHRIEKTGILLSLLLSNCEEGYRKNLSPVQIIDDFFQKHTEYTSVQDKIDVMFRFVQYVERQVVLFDALEDAAFSEVNDMQGPGTLKQLTSEWERVQPDEDLLRQMSQFCIRVVLTAHPTQFYPGSVLGIINDLSKAVAEDNIQDINEYLQQLGKTAFLKKQKPTPYDEAVSLIWYLENVFYTATFGVTDYLKKHFEVLGKAAPVVQLGFWPGGDRDGNPFVTTGITLEVANALRSAIVRCYYRDILRLKRRLTFEGVEQSLIALERKLYQYVFVSDQHTTLTKDEILETLRQIREVIIQQHNGLFVHLVEELITKVEIFGLYFATMDIRQDSSVHGSVLKAMLQTDSSLRLQLLDPAIYADEAIAVADEAQVTETRGSVHAIRAIQRLNGAMGCERYIISQCNSAQNMLEVLELFLLNGWQAEEIAVDIVPLFETIDDLRNAAEIMETLYRHPFYSQHLARRHKKQTIMLGFSDGTKDGGYLMANWSIYKAKESLTTIAREYGIDVVFFDGRGGPTARGGGKTHKFYSSLGRNISGREIQLTVQGQTVSSSYGIVDSATFNLEQLINAGITNHMNQDKKVTLEAEEERLLAALSEVSLEKYVALKNHPGFMEYLSQVSPLRLYNDTNIGSRPAKRNSGTKLTLKDLRAIPYVGSWAQIKQNVTGYYGVGTALKKKQEEGQWAAIQDLYQNSLFFRTLLDNCEMAMKKCFFPLTAFLMDHPVYGEIWRMIHDEYELTNQMLMQLSGHSVLMEAYPVERISVQTRERIVLPLITIQQYAITRIREMQEQLVTSPLQTTYEKLAMRCSFGIINAARNSA